jgi:hypothetical protein
VREVHGRHAPAAELALDRVAVGEGSGEAGQGVGQGCRPATRDGSNICPGQCTGFSGAGDSLSAATRSSRSPEPQGHPGFVFMEAHGPRYPPQAPRLEHVDPAVPKKHPRAYVVLSQWTERPTYGFGYPGGQRSAVLRVFAWVVARSGAFGIALRSVCLATLHSAAPHSTLRSRRRDRARTPSGLPGHRRSEAPP